VTKLLVSDLGTIDLSFGPGRYVGQERRNRNDRVESGHILTLTIEERLCDSSQKGTNKLAEAAIANSNLSVILALVRTVEAGRIWRIDYLWRNFRRCLGK
jgi:hypothetical protein